MVRAMAILRIPALIDPHVHLINNDEQSWRQLARIAAKIGYAGLQVMPDLDPPITDQLSIAHYSQLKQRTAIPLYLTVAATVERLDDLKRVQRITAVKVWLGTGPEELIVNTEEELRQIMLSTDKVVMVHAEDELTTLRNYDLASKELSMSTHNQIYNRKTAVRATVKAIAAAKETGRRVYLCHVSTGEEVELIRQAKTRGIRVYAEVAPHHLFLTKEDVKRLGTKAKVNPPLRSKEDQKALWEAVVDGTIDTVGSDSHSWLLEEKSGAYNQTPTGLPNLELTLPLLLSAVRDKKLDLRRVIEMTSTNPARIFRIPKPTRSLFVDMDNPRLIRPQLTNWHPYDVLQLVGWPIRQTVNR
jgi:dihydroorotase